MKEEDKDRYDLLAIYIAELGCRYSRLSSGIFFSAVPFISR